MLKIIKKHKNNLQKQNKMIKLKHNKSVDFIKFKIKRRRKNDRQSKGNSIKNII